LGIVIDGRALKPVHSSGDRLTFGLPESVAELRLVSRTAMPADARPWLEDRRRLGVYVKRITLRYKDAIVDLPLDIPALRQGWWAVEWEGKAPGRWTTGMLCCPSQLSQGHVGSMCKLGRSLTRCRLPAPREWSKAF